MGDMAASDGAPGLAVQAGIVLCGLLVGCLTREELRAWADRAIADSPDPPVWLIDVSMTPAVRPTDLLKLLTSAAQDAERDPLCPLGFWRRAIELGRVSPETACEQAAGIHLPVGPRKTAIHLCRDLTAARDATERVAVASAMRGFFEEQGRRVHNSAFIDGLLRAL